MGRGVGQESSQNYLRSSMSKTEWALAGWEKEGGGGHSHGRLDFRTRMVMEAGLMMERGV